VTTKSKKPFVPYARISRLNGRTKGDNVSIEGQEQAIRQIAAAYGLKLLPDLVSDEDVSGSTFDRPGWEQALSLVESGKAAGIVAFDLKRISRGKTGEVLAMIEDVEAAGGQIYDSGGPVSVDDADSELITTVKAMIARREWREKRAYLLDSVESTIGRGVHLSAPFGYTKPPRKNNRSQPLKVVEAEAAQVKRAFELRASGSTWGAIAAALNASGAPPRPRKRDGVVKQAAWVPKTVRQIVNNEVYLGTAYNGQHRQPGAHKAIVTPELYAAAIKAKGVKPLGPGEGYLLTGLVRCSGCGYAMSYAAEKQGLYLRCRSAQHGAGACPTPASVPARGLEAYVISRFKADWLGNTWVAEHADETVKAAHDAVESGKATLRVAVKHKIGLGEDPSKSELEIAEEEEALARANLRRLEQELVEAKATARGAALPPELDEERFDSAPVPDQRHWLSSVYRCVVVRKALRWREPAAERARLVSVDEAPADSTPLIAWVSKRPVDG
jgi:DNA invertase Pin-like site-specific DNA recombinase